MAREILSLIAKNQLMAVGPIAERRNRQILARGYVPWKSRADYVRLVYDNLSANVAARGEICGTVMEIGPGGNVGATMLFLRNGCDRGICVDVFPFLQEQDELYELLADGHADLLDRIEYRCPEDIATTAVEDASCDIIFSSACLEHVPDPWAAVRRISALLKPGGVTTHGIDLRDHRNMEQPLRFLRHSDRTWRLATSRRVHTNRWRASDWVDAFEKAGLEDVDVKPVQRVALNGSREWMHRRFRSRSDDDLAIVQVEVTATKPVR